ncbi:protein phosphatase 2C domain-containing protein [Scytonema sp. UIC 10036]|uniref:PP2C family serine/threonine-protein phosphatase n=1 Tax=Scytonema sp. UIC 10036 TaxID=2304196 RepID=UPI0012DAEACE|nr:PP2C family serine/threonine-protein phosphatase [Scytonema sp. UIC 10036]MUG96838.1 protein phosphatase 2C domain-containing protein [Scytonema sp. UIC 10036]
MENRIDTPEWRCIGASVLGASHERTNLPNQDAIQWYPNLGKGPPLILAVSDGHGSPRNFRSDIGAKVAVDTATRVFRELFVEGDLGKERDKAIAIKDIAQNFWLPQKLVRDWKEAIKKHWQENPASDTDQAWQRVVEKDGQPAVAAIQKHPEIAYGATLLVVLVTDSFILYLQLGDGDILCVDSKSKVTRPIQRDPRLIANETTSLCMPDAWKEFQIVLQQYPQGEADKMPALILVSTDGYANSYSTEEEFLKIGQDYLRMIRGEGTERVARKLEEFLKETSSGGSGDDITLGIISRVEQGYKDEELKRMNSLEKNVSDFDTKISHLGSKHNSLSKVVSRHGQLLIVAFFLAIANIAFSSLLFFRINHLEKQQKAFEQHLTDVQQSLQNTQEQLQKLTQNQNKQPVAKPQTTSQQNRQR